MLDQDRESETTELQQCQSLSAGERGHQATHGSCHTLTRQVVLFGDNAGRIELGSVLRAANRIRVVLAGPKLSCFHLKTHRFGLKLTGFELVRRGLPALPRRQDRPVYRVGGLLQACIPDCISRISRVFRRQIAVIWPF